MCMRARMCAVCDCVCTCVWRVIVCVCVCVCVPAQGPAHSENKPEVPQMKLTHAPRPLPPHLCLATAPCLPGAPPTQATHQPIPHPLSRNRVSATASTQSQIPSPVALGSCQASPASSPAPLPALASCRPPGWRPCPIPAVPFHRQVTWQAWQVNGRCQGPSRPQSN